MSEEMLCRSISGVQLLAKPEDLAAILGVSKRTIVERQAKGLSLPKSVKIGRFTRYRQKDIEAWLDSLQEKQEEEQE